LCHALDEPSLIDERLGDRDSLERRLQSAFLTRTALAWSRRLDAAGVPAEIPVDTLEGQTVFHDDDNVRLGLVADYVHPVLGRLRQFGALMNFSDTPERIAVSPPLVGQHSREILRDAGYRDGDIDALIASGTVYEPDDDYTSRFEN
jgi:crotonobetainyl-CoA:carnitine CoA-transferase CaiB-like acyl-CoA transferase